MIHRTSVAFVALAAAVGLSGCVVTPYDGQVVGKYSNVSVFGYTDHPSASVVVEAYNFTTGGWESLGTTTSAATASYGAGYWSSNSPALYQYSLSVQVADQANPATEARWTGWPDGSAKLRVRDTSANRSLSAGEFDSLSCFLSTIEPSSDFYYTAYDCGFQLSEFWLGYIG
ncbi:MAG: hypothetical protein R3F59_03970 [Myxococcota bacterium]